MCYTVKGYPDAQPRPGGTVCEIQQAGGLPYAVRIAKRGRPGFVYFVFSPFRRVYIVRNGTVLGNFFKGF